MGLPWWGFPGSLFLFGVLLILLAIIFPFQIEQEIDSRLSSQFLFDTDSGKGFDSWVSNENSDSVLGWLSVSFYNVTNPDDVACCDDAPILQEIGPFYYQQYQRQINPTFEDLNGERVVTATPFIYLIFNESRSWGPSSTPIVGPAVGYWGILSSAAATNPALRPQLLGVMQMLGSRPFETHTVDQWLFGYNDTLLQVLNSVAPALVPTYTVSLLRNQTTPEDAVAQVNTTTVSCGFPNPARFQQLIKWRGNNNVTYWNPQIPVRGSPGNFFGFRRSGQQEKLTHFWTLIARDIELYHNDTEMYRGIKVYRYRFNSTAFQNATLNPANAQFNQLVFDGAFNLSSVNAAPIFYTQSHFFGADPTLTTFFEGVRSPNAADESYLDIEPLTGATLVTYKALQSNILFGPFEDTSLSVNISRQFLHPQIWYTINSALSDSQIKTLKDSIDFYERAAVATDVILYGGAVVGSLLFLAGVWIAHHRREQQRRETELLLGTEGTGYDLTYGSHATEG